MWTNVVLRRTRHPSGWDDLAPRVAGSILVSTPGGVWGPNLDSQPSGVWMFYYPQLKEEFTVVDRQSGLSYWSCVLRTWERPHVLMSVLNPLAKLILYYHFLLQAINLLRHLSLWNPTHNLYYTFTKYPSWSPWNLKRTSAFQQLDFKVTWNIKLQTVFPLLFYGLVFNLNMFQ